MDGWSLTNTGIHLLNYSGTDWQGIFGCGLTSDMIDSCQYCVLCQRWPFGCITLDFIVKAGVQTLDQPSHHILYIDKLDVTFEPMMQYWNPLMFRMSSTWLVALSLTVWDRRRLECSWGKVLLTFSKYKMKNTSAVLSTCNELLGITLLF